MPTLLTEPVSITAWLGHKGSPQALGLRAPNVGLQAPHLTSAYMPLTFPLPRGLKAPEAVVLPWEDSLRALKVVFKNKQPVSTPLSPPAPVVPSQSPGAMLAAQGHPPGLRGWPAYSKNTGPASYVADDACPLCSAQLLVQS